MTAWIPPVDLHLIFEKMGFSSYLNLNFVGYKDSKNQFRNRPKMKFVEIHFSKSIQKSSADQQGESVVILRIVNLFFFQFL